MILVRVVLVCLRVVRVLGKTQVGACSFCHGFENSHRVYGCCFGDNAVLVTMLANSIDSDRVTEIVCTGSQLTIFRNTISS